FGIVPQRVPYAASKSGPWLLVAILSCAVSGAGAHEVPDQDAEEIVVTGQWTDLGGLAISASEGIVGQEELNIRPRLRTGEVLEVVPGLITTQHSGTGKSNQMFLRGFNLDHGTDFNTSIDGMPINKRSHGHGQGYTDLNFMIPELLETVEFRKGPYHASVGDFSSAGSAHMSTFKVLPESILKIGVGQDGHREILVANSVDAGPGSLLYALEGHAYDGPWVDVEEDLQRVNGILRYSQLSDRGTEWDVMFMGYDASWNSPDQVPQRAIDSGLIDRLGSLDPTLRGETSRYSLSASVLRELSGERQLHAHAYVIDYELDLFSNFTYFLDDPVNGDQFEQVDRRTVLGGSASYVWPAPNRSDSSYTVGMSVQRDDIDEVGLYRTQGTSRLSTVRSDSVTQSSLGLYAEARTRWNDRWRTQLGLRADFYDFSVRSNLPVNSGDTDDFILAPKLSIIYTLDPESELYLSTGRGFHSNDARGTTITVDPGTGDPVDRVDPLVASTGAEIGYRTFRDDKLNVSASLWYLELDSELVFVGDAGGTEPSRSSRRYGIELPIYYRVGNYVFDLELALTNSRYEDDDPAGNEIPGSIERVVAAGVSARYPNGVYGSLRARHFGDRPLIEDGTVRSDSSTVLSLLLGYRRASMDFRVEVLNLLDADDQDIAYFYASRLPGEPAEGVEDIHLHPMEPRTVRASVTWNF
ncbi:MAG: TonB-dependent receptor, partial [Woeseiaceae bacterium]|nr:TonB-dependent receptor [Woeseiaceae bacterium]